MNEPPANQHVHPTIANVLNAASRPTFLDALHRPHDPSPEHEDRFIGRIAADASHLSSGTDASQGGKDAPILSLGQGEYRNDWPDRAAPSTREHRTPRVWEAASARIRADKTLPQEIELRVKFARVKGERGDRDHPGEPTHVEAVAAYLPHSLSLVILRTITHELLSSAFRIRTDGGESRGMLTEETVHDFVRDAGEKIINALDWCADDAADMAMDEDPSAYE